MTVFPFQPVGLPIAVGSRLVPSKNFATADSRAQLVNTTFTALQNAALPLIFLVSPIVYGDKGGTSVTPAWRTSPWHVTASFAWNFDTTLDGRQQVWSHTSHTFDALRALTPGSGAYVVSLLISVLKVDANSLVIVFSWRPIPMSLTGSVRSLAADVLLHLLIISAVSFWGSNYNKLLQIKNK